MVKHQSITIKIQKDLFKESTAYLKVREITFERWVEVQLRVLLHQHDRANLTPTSGMPFGKYQGAMVGDVIRTDPAYITWALDNCKGFSLNDESQAILSTIFEELSINQETDNIQF